MSTDSLSVTSIERLLANIPRLEPDGTNWTAFSMRFCQTMQATRRWGYFDGTMLRPNFKDPSEPAEAEIEALERWEHEDLIACYLLSQCLPDMTVLRLSQYQTAQVHWSRVDDEYATKSTCAQNRLEQAFSEMRCPKGGDVQAFLSSVRCKREELAAAGVQITNKDFLRTVLRGIKEEPELKNFASQLLSAAMPDSAIDTNTLIDHIYEEAERLKTRCVRGQNRGEVKKNGADGALAASGFEGVKKRRRKGKCHNCGKPGHWARECHSHKKEDHETASAVPRAAQRRRPRTSQCAQ